MNVRHYNGVNRGENECQIIQSGKQSSKMNVRQYNGVNRGIKWMSDNTMR